jgi:hypothetical protein
LLLALPPASAQSYVIAPGGTYTVQVTVRKTPYLKLREGEWEVRAYFYDGTVNYCAGEWTEYGYSGWWKWRYKGTDWTDPSEMKTVSVRVSVVPRPRDPVDKDRGMGDIPLDADVSFRIRLIVRDINPEFSAGGEAESGIVTFYIGGYMFQYPYTKDEYDRYYISSDGFEGKIIQSQTGEWRLVVDLDLTARVREDAPKSDTFVIPEALNLTIQSAAAPEPELVLPETVQLGGSILAVAIPAGVALYLAFGRKSGEPEIPQY